MEAAIREPMRARKAFSILGFSLLAAFAVRYGLEWLTHLYAQARGYAEPLSGWRYWVLNYLPFYLIAIPVGILLMRIVPAAPRAKTTMRTKDFFLFLLMCFPLMYAGALVGNLLSLALSLGKAQNGLEALVTDSSPLKYLFMVVIGPFVEEFVFRKTLIDRASAYGEKVAVLFSGMTFGLFHMNLFQFFYAAMLGMLFAYVYVRTRKLRYTVFMHMIINFVGSVIAPLVAANIDTGALLAGDPGSSAPLALAGALLYSSVYMGLSAAGTVMLVLKWKKFIFLPAPAQLERKVHFRTVYLNAGMIAFTAVCLGMCVYALFRA